METFNHPDRTLFSTVNQAAEAQLVRPALAARCGMAHADAPARIRALQANGMTLQAVQERRDAASAQRALSALAAELIGLRAERAWRRAEARANERFSSIQAAEPQPS